MNLEGINIMKLSEALDIVVRTDPGKVRAHNEDAVFGDAGLGLAILADGMGGYNAGEIASGMAVTLLSGGFSGLIPGGHPEALDPASGKRVSHGLLQQQVAGANQAIFHAAESQSQYAGMGTTLVVAWFYDNLLTVGHIGDSRLYRYRAGEFKQITRDHSLLQEQIDSGMISPEEARFSQNKNLVTRALGVDAEVELEIHDYDVEVGDVYLLCSDGLNDMVGDDEIGEAIEALSSNLELAAEQLIQMANDNGGRDNVSVVLVKVRGGFETPRSWWQKLMARLN